ncbi:hypothetical protein [Halorhabdus amylolytica]|uniref:hypothetical protein n=1 Tax=Halorhabdus amylolytica TaxID=2559573 RepID=UPI0010AADFE7|nr:hypothetical protein [Halorhabdus amylolytica]
MSTDNYDSGDGDETVQDDGSVDQKLKNRIIDARKRVDEREDQLFVQGLAAGISREEKTQAWGTVVRQYIRAIEPLLKSDDVKKAEYYYLQAYIGKQEIPPPDGEYPWSELAYADNTWALFTEYGLPANIDLPEPQEIEFEGLYSVLKQKQVSAQWQVDLKPESFGPGGEQDRLGVSYPVPKEVLEEAVSTADEFLQQAGIGLEIGKEPHGNT